MTLEAALGRQRDAGLAPRDPTPTSGVRGPGRAAAARMGAGLDGPGGLGAGAGHLGAEAGHLGAVAGTPFIEKSRDFKA